MKPELPSRDAFKWWDSAPGHSYDRPPDLPDNRQTTETLLTDHRGRPILVRRPRPFGFDPRRLDE